MSALRTAGSGEAPGHSDYGSPFADPHSIARSHGSVFRDSNGQVTVVERSGAHIMMTFTLEAARELAAALTIQCDAVDQEQAEQAIIAAHRARVSA